MRHVELSNHIGNARDLSTDAEAISKLVVWFNSFPGKECLIWEGSR